MAWLTSLTELRTLLSDGLTDRFGYRKRCFGETNGVNRDYKTFEFRRVTDFTQTQGVYKNGSLLPITSVASDVLATGIFTLVTAPIDGDIIEANYYTQWFLDSELQSFLTNASRWLTSQDDYTLIEGGLIPAALKYAAADAYQKMAERWRLFMSADYKVEDNPQKGADPTTSSFLTMAKTYRADALDSRDDFFTRQGRKLQPLFSSISGNIKGLT